MLSSLVVAATVAFGAGPGDFDGRYSTGSVAAYGHFQGSGFGGELYPFDGPEPWLHGYFQEIPAYGGYVSFKPYNYKHVLSQSQAAAGLGLPSTMPYSQQFWHRYHARGTMSPAMHSSMHQPLPAQVQGTSYYAPQPARPQYPQRRY